MASTEKPEEIFRQLSQLHARILSSPALDRPELTSMATPLLSRLATAGRAPTTLAQVDLLLEFYHEPNVANICARLAAVSDKGLLGAARDRLGRIYGKCSRQDCFRLALATRVYEPGVVDRLAEAVVEMRKGLLKQAASGSKSAEIDGEQLDLIMRAVEAMAGCMDISSSYRLGAAICDLVVALFGSASLTLNMDTAWRALETLVMQAPCRHPLLAVVLHLMQSAGISTRNLEVIVHPRRSPMMKARKVEIDVPVSQSCTIIPADKVEPNEPAKVRELAKSAVFQPDVSKRIKVDFDDLPEFVLDGPDT